MIGLVEGAKRQKAPNEIAPADLCIIVVRTCKPFGFYSHTLFRGTVPVALPACLIPTTIGGRWEDGKEMKVCRVLGSLGGI